MVSVSLSYKFMFLIPSNYLFKDYCFYFHYSVVSRNFITCVIFMPLKTLNKFVWLLLSYFNRNIMEDKLQSLNPLLLSYNINCWKLFLEHYYENNCVKRLHIQLGDDYFVQFDRCLFLMYVFSMLDQQSKHRLKKANWF